MNLLVVKFPPASCSLVPLRSKYLPQRPVFEKFFVWYYPTVLVSKNLKIKIYRNIILPIVLYGCETW